MESIWLFGAGKHGKRYVEECGNASVRGFVDNDSNKQGKKFEGIYVYSYEEFVLLADREKDVIYITALKGREQFFIQLMEDGYKKVKVYVPGGGVVCIEKSWGQTFHSQLGEEIGVRHFFQTNGYPLDYKGFYLDIGAFHPFVFNNTKWAYDKGWRGMNIDANEESIKLFNIFRPEDINVNCGVSDRDEELEYHMFHDSGAKNTFLIEQEDTKEETEVKMINMRNINDILDEYHVEKIDFVDIDIEGLEEKVVQTFNWKKYRPTCVLIEFLGKSIEGVLKTAIHKKMREEGYTLASFYTITALYINYNFREM